MRGPPIRGSRGKRCILQWYCRTLIGILRSLILTLRSRFTQCGDNGRSHLTLWDIKRSLRYKSLLQVARDGEMQRIEKRLQVQISRSNFLKFCLLVPRKQFFLVLCSRVVGLNFCSHVLLEWIPKSQTCVSEARTWCNDWLVLYWKSQWWALLWFWVSLRAPTKRSWWPQSSVAKTQCGQSVPSAAKSTTLWSQW